MIKLGVFQKGKLSEIRTSSSIEDLTPIIENLNPGRVILSSVNIDINTSVIPLIKSFPSIVLNHTTLVPFELDYETPKTLGVDRLAAAAGAQTINPEGNSMIIDAGTCITYDILERGHKFKGGVISPGMSSRYKAMHDYTGKLPLILDTEAGEEIELIGSSTKKAMKSGVINGIKSEMNSFINQYKELFPDLKVIMCGGEAKFFESRLKASIFAVPELVLLGLNRILEYNA